MGASGSILLTGATGFLGRHLVRELLLSGRQVAVLVRDVRSVTTEERVAELVQYWSETLGTRLTSPVVLAGDVSVPGLGLQAADRRWLATHCRAVVHAAARIGLRRAPGGEPWKTNVEGTQHLLDLCTALGIAELHHVSTAFVCGDRTGTIREEELDHSQGFHNEYEQSKFEAEQRVRGARNLQTTVYRPSVIVGDSRTGYTSTYQGFYRFLELGNRLAEPGRGKRILALRLPFTGEEPRNLVPVDWVAQAVTRIVNQPRWHGRTYHLVARESVRARLVKEVAEELLQVDGVQWAGPGRLAEATPLEERFVEYLQEYWPYLQGDPDFDCRNTCAALPQLPAPRVDRAMLSRLIRFAIADEWGHATRKKAPDAADVDCADYVERFFPESARRSTLAQIPLNLTVALDIRGSGGGHWSCRWKQGELVDVRQGGGQDADVTYRTDSATFAAIVRGRQAPQEAFFAKQVEIEGQVENALKLAVLFGQFVREFPYGLPQHQEAIHAAALST